MGYDDWFHGQPAVVCVFRRVVAAIQLESHAGSADEATDKETLAENSDNLDARTVSQHGDGSAALHDPFRGHGPIDTYHGHKERLAKAARATQDQIAAPVGTAVAVTALAKRHRRSSTHHPGAGCSEGFPFFGDIMSLSQYFSTRQRGTPKPPGCSEGVGNSNSAMDQGALPAHDSKAPWGPSNAPHKNASTPHDRGPEASVSGPDASAAFAALNAESTGEDAHPGKQPTFRAEYVHSYVAPRDEVHYESAVTVETSGMYMEPSLGFSEAAIQRGSEHDVQYRLHALDEQIALASATMVRAEALAAAAEDCADLVQARLVNEGESGPAWLSMNYGFWL